LGTVPTFDDDPPTHWFSILLDAADNDPLQAHRLRRVPIVTVLASLDLKIARLRREIAAAEKK
jgi:hypothetical protein